MADPSTSAEGSSSHTTSLPSHTSPTILSTLHTLLLSSSSIPAPLNHPYAPAPNFGSWKGKSRENNSSVNEHEQRRLLEQLRDGVEAAKSVLGRAAKEEGRSKLARAMKDVTTHQSALLPLLPSITPTSRRPPSFRTPPKPIDLLTALSQRLGIETYLEESQFGLLKTTLAIAGKRFVLDVELEADSSAMGDEAETPLPTPAPTPHPTVPLDVESSEGRDKVRLAKLVVNHVTKDGGTASSSSIAIAIRQSLEAYLKLWNDAGSTIAGEEVIKRLWEDMSDLAALDMLTEEGGRDWFAELEGKAETILALAKSAQIFSEVPSVLPRFGLLPESRPYQFRLRPSVKGESVTNPFDSDGTETNWILEYVPDSMPGVVVRRNWLSLESSSEVESGTGIRVEQLLCTPIESSNGFPYTAEFAYTTSTKEAAGLEQRWSVVQPGPAGYLVGRLGWSDEEGHVKQLLKALRRQAMLNGMLARVLDPSKLQFDSPPDGADGDDEDDDIDLDMLSKAPIALPITLTITADGLRAVMPLPHSGNPSSAFTLTFTPSGDASDGVRVDWAVAPESDSEARIRIESAVESGRGAASDPVEAVRRIEQALR